MKQIKQAYQRINGKNIPFPLFTREADNYNLGSVRIATQEEVNSGITSPNYAGQSVITPEQAYKALAPNRHVPIAVPSKNIYVDAANGDDNNDGLTPETSMRSLEEAVSRVVSGYYNFVGWKSYKLDGNGTFPSYKDYSFCFNIILAPGEYRLVSQDNFDFTPNSGENRLFKASFEGTCPTIYFFSSTLNPDDVVIHTKTKDNKYYTVLRIYYGVIFSFIVLQ